LGKTSIKELFPEALIDEIGAEVYKESCNFLRTHAPGFFQKTLVSATSSTQEHTWPTDFVRLVRMVVSSDGTSLETDETVGTEVFYIPPTLKWDYIQTGTRHGWSPQQGGFRLYPKVATAGAKALLLEYEYQPSFASTGTDTITWPDNHSTLLVVKTAVQLRDAISNMDARGLMRLESRLEHKLLIDLKTVDMQLQQFPTSAFRSNIPIVSVQGEVG
jgi:hypothetical protein